MSRKSKGAIAQMKQQVETLTLRMQFFHLDPKWKNFLEICDCTKLQSEQGHVYDIWRLGCLTTYADEWVEQYGDTHELLTPEAQERHMEEFMELEDKLQRKVSEYPNSTALDQVWYLYFATGEYIYLKTAFELAGHHRAKPGLREDAVVMYTTIKEQYADKIREAEEHDSGYFDNHDCFATRSAKYNWERLDAEINSKNIEMDEKGITTETTDAEIDEILAEVKEYKFVADGEENNEHAQKIQHGADVFNRVLLRLKENDEL
jgi:hypothetical protein